jgi:hypothetical protein
MKSSVPLVSSSLCRFFRTLLIGTLVGFTASAAQLDGVQVPETYLVNGKTLYLNGLGLRTYSILNVHIYAASLYLEHLSTDADKILHSLETKLLAVRFEHAVSAEDAQKAWRDGLANNCLEPCRIDPGDLATFLSQVPAMRVGDNFNLIFTRTGAVITVNGQQIGTIERRQFAEALLATFLGPNPASPTLRQQLLMGHS